MESNSNYNINLEVKYGHLEIIDIPQIVASVAEKWWNQTLTEVNNSVVRIGIVEGEFHWHKHDRDDEFFFVLEGHFIIDLEDRSIDLQPQQGFVVPRGVMHRTRAPERAVILMAETAAIVPTGDA